MHPHVLHPRTAAEFAADVRWRNHPLDSKVHWEALPLKQQEVCHKGVSASQFFRQMILLQRGLFKNIDSRVSNERNPDEKEIHLTNNAIQKNMSNYEKI
jgi:hypothetical protein